MQNQDFELAIEKATLAANQAGDIWMLEHAGPNYDINNPRQVLDRMLDLCGGAYIELKDRRTRFAKWLKKIKGSNQIWSVDIDHKYRGFQEMGLHIAVKNAAYNVLTKEFGIRGITLRSYID